MRYQALFYFFWITGSFIAGCNISNDQQVQSSKQNNFISPYLIKDSSLYDYFSIDNDGIKLYATPMDKRMATPEIHIYPDEIERFKQLFIHLTQDSILQIYQDKGIAHWTEDKYRHISQNKNSFNYGINSQRPLEGLKVAIDPGHIAPDVIEGELEGKYVKMHPSPQTRMKTIRFNEATLTLTTAYLIKDELEQMGAEVLLSRGEMGKNAMGKTYKQWLKEDFEKSLTRDVSSGKMTQEDVKWWRVEATERDLYRRRFNVLDLKNRAKKINAFHPHLTLIIHYNIDSPNWERRDADGFFPPTGANYCMAFVPGSFMRGELNKIKDRVSFLRLLLTQDIDESIRLTDHFIKSSNRLTGVPIVQAENQLGYLSNACILTESPGVYARNLTLTNLIQGPLCYGESLCQDNVVETLMLNKKDIEVHGVPTSSRVQDVAKAYIQATIKFAEEGI